MRTVLTYAGTALAAIAASACCWIPALLGAGAAGSLGISAALAPWRPYLLALTGLFLLGGFWMVYRKPKADCCASGGCATPAAARRRKVNIGVMWTVAVFAVAMAAYPNLLAAKVHANEPVSPIAAKAFETTLVFSVEGMDCEACAAPIKAGVERVPGVTTARVDLEKKRLAVIVAKPRPQAAAILAAVEKAGFKAQEIKEQ
ncbi:MAG: heavy-metal-associated domain-containing protein [Fimbriimonadaceae bacterium]|nr:heavy-metal-associated domain-containing protein [Fimbriimonadaceae bacterium]QOJ12474.1 MAG: heavy-metal-associated domain-containing protein [Chthonomonadaceae bacterium]